MAVKFLSDISSTQDLIFKNASGVDAGLIQMSGDNLIISNSIGDVLFGDVDSDVYIGDGINNVNIIFEQSGSIKGEDGGSTTLTIGSADTTLKVINPTWESGATLTSKLTIGTGGSIDFTPDTGVLLTFDGQTILERTTPNGALTLGHDDSVIIAGGDTSVVLNTNISNGTETVFIGAEGGLEVYAFPNNDTSWSNRKIFTFSNDSNFYLDGRVYPSSQTTNYVDSTRIANWQAAYGWGNHATAGYLTSETYSTASELLTAIKTVDGSGSGLDADTLDAISSSSFLRSDVDDTFGNAGKTLTIQGVVRSNNNGNVYGPNFNVSTTNKDTAEYAYRVDRSGTVVGGIKIGGQGVFADGLTVGSAYFTASTISNWNTAYSWGNHASAGYLTTVAWGDVTGTPTTLAGYGITDADNYGSWNLKTGGVQRTTVQSGGTLDIVGGTNVSVSYSAGGVVTIASTDTNTTYSAGSGLTLTGTTFAHADTSTQASVNNSGRTYIQDITLDTYGHITAITSATETVVNTDTNYYVDGLSFDTATGVLTASVNGTTNQTVDLDGRYQLAGTYNTIIGTDTDINTSGATIIDNIFVTDGVITSMGTRTLSPADIGAATSSHNHDGTYFKFNTANQSGYLGLNQNPVSTTYGDGVSTTPSYYFGQKVGDNDGWRLYGEAPSSNDVKMIFEIIDDIEGGDTWVFRNKKTYSPWTANDVVVIGGDGTITTSGRLYIETVDTSTSSTGLVLGAGGEVEKRTLGSNAFTSTNIPQNVSELTNDSGYITDGNTGWNNTYGFITASDSITGSSASAAKLTDGGGLTTQPGTNNLIFTGQISAGTTGLFATSDNSNAIITLNRHSGNYDSQLGFSSNGNIYYRKFSNSTAFTTQAWLQVWHSGNFTQTKINNWDTAYGWGDHSAAGYITSLAGYATETYVGQQISNLVDSAPAALDTLNELAAALGDDANFSTTMSTALGNRLRVDTASQGLTSTQKSNARTNLGLGTAATTASTAYATAAQGTNADTAYGWGNHASAGYLTTVAFGDITGTPTTIAGYGITDAFDGAYGSLTGVPSTFAPSAHNQAWSTITSTPTTLAGYGITDAVASSSYTAADVLAKIKTVDGAGSGLDADTLDGVSSGSFLRSDTNDVLNNNLVINQVGGNGGIVYEYSGGVYVPKPNGANYATTTSSFTGAIEIALPTDSWNQSDMISFWVDIYDYNGGSEGESVSLYVYGYPYGTGSWTNCGAVILTDRTDRDYTVRFGHNGSSRHLVYIGETTSTWNYLQISIRDFQAGYSGQNTGRWNNGWAITPNIGSFSNVQRTSSNNYPVTKQLQTARNIALTGDVTGNANFDGSANISISSNIASNVVGAAELNVSGNGSSGQVLTSDGDGTFSWSNKTTNTDTNYYLDGITKSGNTLTFSVSGATNQTYTFGSNAFNSTTIPTNNNQLTNGAGYITGYTVTSSDVTTALGYTPYQEGTALSASTGAFSGDITVSGNQVITTGTNADVKFSVWSGTTYGIGMTSGVTYGGLNDYAMTFCMNNDSDRGFWWGYSGQTKSSGAMSLTTAGVLTVASSITAGGAVTGSNLNVSNWDTAYSWGDHASAGYLTAHPNITAASSSNNSGRTYIQDITVDSNGHVTGISTATETVTDTNTTYSTATSSTLGLVKIGYTENGKNYPVELSSGKMFVNVPWTDTNTTYSVATTSANGLMSSTDKSKLDGIAANANNYVHPTSAGNKHIPSGGAAGQFLKYSSSGTAVWATPDYTTNTDTITSVGVSGSETTGTVTIAASGAASVSQSGSTITIDATNTTYTVGDGGLTQKNFTTALKTKLDGIATGADAYGGWRISDGTTTENLGSGDTLTVVGTNACQVTYNSTTNTLTIDGADNNTTYSAGSDYGIALSGTEIRLKADRRRNLSTADIYTGNTHDYTFYDADIGIRWYTAGAEEMRLEDDGDLHVDGDVIAFSTTVSDARLKDDVETIENATDKVKQLRGVEYTWNKGSRRGQREIGVIAQEVEAVVPEVVHDKKLPLVDDETYKTVDYEKLVALLIESNKELAARVETLEAKLDGFTK